MNIKKPSRQRPVVLLVDPVTRTPLSEPKYYESHAELYRSYGYKSPATVYRWLQYGWCYEPIGSCPSVPQTQYAQKSSHSSPNFKGFSAQSLQPGVLARQDVGNRQSSRCRDTLTNIEYDTQKQAASSLGVTPSMISYWIKTGRFIKI